MIPVRATDGVISLRPQTSADKSYLMKTWLMSLAPRESEGQFYKYGGPALEERLTDNNVVIACLSEDTNVIVGFSVRDKAREEVFFIIVRKAWINTGVFEALCTEAGEIK